jgi:DNA-binding GntR family transcriptional regulator
MIKTAERIRQELEQAIIMGEFREGERLDEIRLTERFRVSRTPVREALHLLSASGLVEVKPRRGAFVHYPSLAELVEMFEVMAVLEATCGGLAARRASQEQIAALESACEACETALRHGDADVYYRENETFHQVLYAASANSFLESEALKLQRRLQPFRRMQLRVRGRIGQSMDEHRQILAAIKAGDALQAETLIRAHIAIQGQKFNDLVASYRIATQRKAG